MSNGRPRLSPSVMASLAEMLPARLRRRLDEDPALAEGWSWSWSAEMEVVEIVASEDARVRLDAPGGVVANLGQVHCTCLLAPRCLHVSAVLLRLPLTESEVFPPAAPTMSVEAAPGLALSDDQRLAARQAWQAGAALLNAGAAGAGLLLTGELLRAVHSCREAGLHRLAADGLRVAQRLRDLHAERPEFRLGALAGDLADLLATSRHLAHASDVDAVWVGTARRAYLPAGSLRVMGLFTEAVVSAAGFAGVVTYVTDQHGVIWSLGDVVPGPPERCQQAYGSPIDLGDAAIDHRTLSREGLHLQRASASDDGRLGSGRAVGAVRAGGCAWTDPPLAGLWQQPLDAQLDRAWGARDGAAGISRAGTNLLFVRGSVAGVRDNALEVTLDSGLTVACLAASDHTELAYRANLRLLGGAPGLALSLIGRVVFGRPRALILLAVAPERADGEPFLDLPPGLGPRVNLGLDVLQHAHVRGGAGSPVLLPTLSDGSVLDPLATLRRRLYQVVSGGRSAVSEPAWSGIERDSRQLVGAHLGTAAEVLGAMRAAASERTADQRRELFARAWLTAWTYHAAASARLQRLSWTG